MQSLQCSSYCPANLVPNALALLCSPAMSVVSARVVRVSAGRRSFEFGVAGDGAENEHDRAVAAAGAPHPGAKR